MKDKIDLGYYKIPVMSNCKVSYKKAILDLLIGDTLQEKFEYLRAVLGNYDSMIETNRILVERIETLFKEK